MPEETAVRNKVNSHVSLVKRHFSTLADSFDYGKWNRYCIMVYDCTKIITGYKTSYFPGTKCSNRNKSSLYTRKSWTTISIL